MSEGSTRIQKLQQFFSKSNVYQNTSIQQIERQKLTISNESKIVKDISQIEEEIKPQLIRPYQNEFDRDMYLMAKPLIQPLLQLNIVSKPEINPKINQLSNQLHRELDQAVKRSEAILIEKKYASIKPGESNEKIYNERFLNQLRQQNRRSDKSQNRLSKDKSEPPPQTIKYEPNSPQRKLDKDFDFKSINKKSIKDHTEQIRLPTKIKDIHQIGITLDDQQAQDDTFIMQTQPSQYETLNEKINFESIISIAAGQVDDHGIQELVKNVQIAKRFKQIKNNQENQNIIEELDSSIDFPVDKMISAHPILQDQSMQMSNKETQLPRVQNVLNGIRLAKNQYYTAKMDEKQYFKQILRNHLNDLLQILMVHYPPQPTVNDSINYLLSLKKSDLAQAIDGMSKLELLYIFLSEYKCYQQLDQKNAPQTPKATPVKGYMKPTKTATLKKLRK